MNLGKKIILLGLILIFIMTGITTFSFANEEKDYINRALKLIDEEKYNETVGRIRRSPGLNQK